MGIHHLFDLTGKVAVVTGGARGLGRVMAEGLAEAGAHVVVCSRKAADCEQTAEEFTSKGFKAVGLRCDLSNEDDVDQVVTATIRHFQHVDVLVNNAGRTWGASPEDFKLKEWKKVIEVNINGTFLMSQRVGKEMIKQSHGRIINISSYAGLGGTDPEHLDAIAYNTSKGAVITFTKDLATKWAKYGINVNCIAPGWFPTKMTQWILDDKPEVIRSRILTKRFGKDDDLKGVVVFLASRASDYVTGQVISVDGGLTVWF